MSVIGNSWLHWFCFTPLCDWSRKLAPFSQLIRCEAKTNHDLVARVYPRFGQFSCFLLGFSLAPKGTFPYSDRPLGLLWFWFWFYATQSKSALMCYWPWLFLTQSLKTLQVMQRLLIKTWFGHSFWAAGVQGMCAKVSYSFHDTGYHIFTHPPSFSNLCSFCISTKM